MHALVHMQPLTINRKPHPVYARKFVGTIPRDAQPHRVSGEWELDHSKEMPHYVRVWADDRSIDVEVLTSAPAHLRKLKSITFVQDLTVLPRRQ